MKQTDAEKLASSLSGHMANLIHAFDEGNVDNAAISFIQALESLGVADARHD